MITGFCSRVVILGQLCFPGIVQLSYVRYTGISQYRSIFAQV